MQTSPLRIFSGIAAAIALTFTIAVVVFYSYDFNQLRPYINHLVSNSTGRTFEVRGNLKIQLQRGAQSESDWMSYVPVLRISADDVQISNPAWTTVGTQMASVRQIVVTLKPLPLFGKKIVVTELIIDTPMLALERQANGIDSWSLRDNGPSTWHTEISHLTFSDGNLRFLDHHINLDLHVQASSLNSDGSDQDRVPMTAAKNSGTAQQYGVQFDLGGKYRNTPISGSGRAGAVLTLENKTTVYPVQANAQSGENKITIDGVISDPTQPNGVNLTLTLSGVSLAELFPLTGILLPETPKFNTSGRLLGQKNGDYWNWTYQNFKGIIGSSDLTGTLNFVGGQPRAMLSGSLTSNELRLGDLAPVVGADNNVHKVARGHAPVQPDGKALPAEEFHTENWGFIDADVKFTGKHLIRTHNIPLQDVFTEIHLRDKVMNLDPLDFGMAGGDVKSTILLDGRKSPIDAKIKIAARNLQLRELFPTLQSMQASFGKINADARLTGQGNSISAMLATSNGDLAATVSPGSISKFVLEAAGLNVANVIFVEVFGDKQIRLNCLVSDFSVKDGSADVRRFVMDTDDAVVVVRGDINLADEVLNLDVHPFTKGIRLFTLRTPLYAKGTFEHPDVGPYKGMLAARALAAVALGTLAPPAAALALVNLDQAPTIDCPAELEKALQTRNAAKSGVTVPRDKTAVVGSDRQGQAH